MFSKQAQVAALVALAAVVSLVPGRSAQAGTAKSYSYIAWVETQSVIYMVNQTYDYEDLRWEWAHDANVEAQLAFLEILDATNNVRGSSWLVARDHLDEAAFNLYLLAGQPLPRNIRDRVNSAQRYISFARSQVQKQILND